MAATGQGGDDGSSATSIEVNVDDLTDFQAFLSRELNLNLEPGSDEVMYDHTMGVRFGNRSPGQNTVEAVKTYFKVLTVSTMNLQEYVRTARTLVEVVGAVTASYRASDLSAAGSTQKFGDALAAAFKESSDAASALRGSETNRETYRATGPTAVSPL